MRATRKLGVVACVGSDDRGLGRRLGRVHVVVSILDGQGRGYGRVEGLQSADQPSLAILLRVFGHGSGVLRHPVHLEGVGVVAEPEDLAVEARQGERLHHLGHAAHVAARLAVAVAVLTLVHLEEDERKSWTGVDDKVDEGARAVHVAHAPKVNVLLADKVSGRRGGVDVPGTDERAEDTLLLPLAPGLTLSGVVAVVMTHETTRRGASVVASLDGAFVGLFARMGAPMGHEIARLRAPVVAGLFARVGALVVSEMMRPCEPEVTPSTGHL